MPPKRPKCTPKRRNVPADVTKTSSPNDVTESPSQPTENPSSDFIVNDDAKNGYASVTESSSRNDVTESPSKLTENPPSDVIVTDDAKNGYASVGPQREMSKEELLCYDNYINQKLDEYEPTLVSENTLGCQS